MQFQLIGSTGRTATTFIAHVINNLDGVIGCHEGYVGAQKDTKPLLPLINLDNAAAYASHKKAIEIASQKRSINVVNQAVVDAGRKELNVIDVAYYNSIFAESILETNTETKFIGIIRKAAPFVRSATAIEGEDLLPVGWPDVNKPLSAREKFISMGRIRPIENSPESAEWNHWSAIQKNIWLWRETNLRMIRAKERYPERVLLLDFENLKRSQEDFWFKIDSFFEMGHFEELVNFSQSVKEGVKNRKLTGYQIPLPNEWSQKEQLFLRQSENLIKQKVDFYE